MEHFYYPTNHFKRQLEHLERDDINSFKRVSKVIDRLLVDPTNADGKMRGIYDGRLKKYVGRADYRIIYHWCSQCRKEKMHLTNSCGQCGKIPENSVIFFELYHKKDMKKLQDHSDYHCDKHQCDN